MFESILFGKGKRFIILNTMGLTFLITIVIGLINNSIGSVSLFLVALISLALSYPVISYVKGMDRREIDSLEEKTFFQRYEKEIVVFIGIFLGSLFAFYILDSTDLTSDFTYEQQFANSASGMSIFSENSFFTIFANNFKVMVLTFIISFFVFSGLLFVILWNASIIAFYLSSFESHKVALVYGLIIFSHSVLEIGGYILAGLAGGLLSHRLYIAIQSRHYFVENEFGNLEKRKDRRSTFQKLMNKRLAMDVMYLLIASFSLILLGSINEVL